MNSAVSVKSYTPSERSLKDVSAECFPTLRGKCCPTFYKTQTAVFTSTMIMTTSRDELICKKCYPPDYLYLCIQ